MTLLVAEGEEAWAARWRPGFDAVAEGEEALLFLLEAWFDAARC